MPAHNTIVCFILGSVVVCAGPRPAPEPVVEVAGDRATVRGVVAENVRRCEVDGPCYLILRGRPASVRVYYHLGEYPPCSNREAIRAGQSIRPGDTIEASGSYRRAGNDDVVEVCADGDLLKRTAGAADR